MREMKPALPANYSSVGLCVYDSMPKELSVARNAACHTIADGISSVIRDIIASHTEANTADHKALHALVGALTELHDEIDLAVHNKLAVIAHLKDVHLSQFIQPIVTGDASNDK